MCFDVSLPDPRLAGLETFYVRVFAAYHSTASTNWPLYYLASRARVKSKELSVALYNTTSIPTSLQSKTIHLSSFLSLLQDFILHSTHHTYKQYSSSRSPSAIAITHHIQQT